jgi:hypothetical protein
LAFGTQREAVKLSDDMDNSASDHAWGGTTTVGGAIDVLAIDNRYVGIGLRFEIAYTYASAPALTTNPDRPDDGTIKLPMSEAELGRRSHHRDPRGSMRWRGRR